MPDASELLSTLHRRGVKVWVDKEQLRLQAPAGTLLPADLHELRTLKVELIDLLRQTEFDIPPRSPGCEVPLTPMQRFSWTYCEQGRAGERVCNVTLRIRGALQPTILASCLQAVIERHESLRTRIVVLDGAPMQQIDAASRYHLEEIDLSGLPAEALEAEAMRIARQFLQERFDLSVGPAFAVKLLKLSDRDFIFIMALDHTVADAASTEILSNEIWALYEQARQGQPFSLPDLPVQFADYAVWQHLTCGSWMKQHAPYWRRRLTDAPRIRLTATDRLPKAEHPVGALLHVPFGDALSTKLREVARRERTQLSMVVFCIFTAVILRWCDSKDLVLRFLISGRHHPKLQNMIGFLAEFLHLRIQITERTTLLDLLRQGDLEFQSAYKRHDFGRVPEFIPQWAWKMDVIDLRFQWAPSSTAIRPSDSGAGGGLDMQPMSLAVAKPFEFLPIFYDSPSGIGCSVIYRSDVFAPGTMERFGSHLLTVGTDLVERSFVRVNSILLR